MAIGKKAVEAYLKKPYLRILTPDEESGTYAAEIPEFPGCVAQGDTPQKAYANLEKVAAGWIEAALDLGQQIPEPTTETGYGGKVALRLPKSLHRQAAIAAERDGVSVNQFIVFAVAEKVGAGAVQNVVLQRLEELMRQSGTWSVQNTPRIVCPYEKTAKLETSGTHLVVPGWKEVTGHA